MSILWLDSSDATNRKTVGAKAATTAELRLRGFPAPTGFVLSVEALNSFLEHNHLLADCGALSKATDITALVEQLSAMRARLDEARWPAGLRLSITAAYDRLSGAVAVRSSGVAEDEATSSFAGAYSSFLNRTTVADVLSAIQSCWRSGFSERVASYRLEHGLVERDWAMGVIVQRMFFAEKAGVIFTRNPFADDDSLLLEAVAGRCDQIVAGRPADLSIWVDRSTRHIVRIQQASKEPKRFGGGATGLLSATIPHDPRLLRKSESDDLIQMALRIEAAFGGPQDVEWALSQREVAVLQTRPMTAHRFAKQRT